MRFGTFVPQGWKYDLAGLPVADQWPLIAATAATIEASGYDSLWVYDHFHTHPGASQESTFEAWSLMAGLAAITSRVRLGQMCTCIPLPTGLSARQDRIVRRRHVGRAPRRRHRSRDGRTENSKATATRSRRPASDSTCSKKPPRC